MVAIIVIVRLGPSGFFMIAMNLGHLGGFVAVPDIFENLLETGKASKLFLLSLVFDIGDAVGVSSAGE